MRKEKEKNLKGKCVADTDKYEFQISDEKVKFRSRLRHVIV